MVDASVRTRHPHFKIKNKKKKKNKIIINRSDHKYYLCSLPYTQTHISLTQKMMVTDFMHNAQIMFNYDH